MSKSLRLECKHSFPNRSFFYYSNQKIHQLEQSIGTTNKKYSEQIEHFSTQLESMYHECKRALHELKTQDQKFREQIRQAIKALIKHGIFLFFIKVKQAHYHLMLLNLESTKMLSNKNLLNKNKLSLTPLLLIFCMTEQQSHVGYAIQRGTSDHLVDVDPYLFFSLYLSDLDNSRPNIRITVIKAESLYKKHIFKKPDPFVVVTADGQQVSSSQVIKGTTSPFWNFTCYYKVNENSVVSIQLFDQRHFKEPKQGFLGVVNILIKSVINLQSRATSKKNFYHHNYH